MRTLGFQLITFVITIVVFAQTGSTAILTIDVYDEGDRLRMDIAGSVDLANATSTNSTVASTDRIGGLNNFMAIFDGHYTQWDDPSVNFYTALDIDSDDDAGFIVAATHIGPSDIDALGVAAAGTGTRFYLPQDYVSGDSLSASVAFESSIEAQNLITQSTTVMYG